MTCLDDLQEIVDKLEVLEVRLQAELKQAREPEPYVPSERRAADGKMQVGDIKPLGRFTQDGCEHLRIITRQDGNRHCWLEPGFAWSIGLSTGRPWSNSLNTRVTPIIEDERRKEWKTLPEVRAATNGWHVYRQERGCFPEILSVNGKWRIIEQVKHVLGYKSKPEAEAALTKYYKDQGR